MIHENSAYVTLFYKKYISLQKILKFQRGMKMKTHLFSSQRKNIHISVYDLKVFFLSFFFFNVYVFILFGLCCCTWAFFSCGECEPLSSCSAQASHLCGFSCSGARAQGKWASEVVAHGLSCSVASPLHRQTDS